MERKYHIVTMRALSWYSTADMTRGVYKYIVQRSDKKHTLIHRDSIQKCANCDLDNEILLVKSLWLGSLHFLHPQMHSTDCTSSFSLPLNVFTLATSIVRLHISLCHSVDFTPRMYCIYITNTRWNSSGFFSFLTFFQSGWLFLVFGWWFVTLILPCSESMLWTVYVDGFMLINIGCKWTSGCSLIEKPNSCANDSPWQWRSLVSNSKTSTEGYIGSMHDCEHDLFY